MKTEFNFVASLRVEIFFAIETLLDPSSRIHDEWKQPAIQKLPETFFSVANESGFSSNIWASISDALQTQPLDLNISSIISKIENQPLEEFQRNILHGLLHFDNVVDMLLNKGYGLEEALNKIPKTKREWLSFVDVYPFKKNAPMIKALNFLLESPLDFRNLVIDLISTFWKLVFKDTWSELLPKLNSSLKVKSRLFASSDLGEFTKHALIRIEVDEKKKVIKALRGGFRLPLDLMRTCTFIPSAFNDKRYWTCFKSSDGTYTIYFPYFEPSISLDSEIADSLSYAEPELDPALIFKALGDHTRYQIISLIAEFPLSSVQLSQKLSISKATVSHHVHILREAGLLTERYSSGSVILSLKREVVENLSSLIINKMYK